MFRLLLTASLLAGSLAATTLERLSLDEMILKSTSIVRGRVNGTYADVRGQMIYTHFNVIVSERWKGPAAARVDVVTPGGTAGRLRQTFSGVPKLEDGAEYVLFIWTSKSGLNHVIGLSQGVFDLKVDTQGEPFAVRAACSEALLDPVTGRPVNDETLRISLSELRQRIGRVLGARE